MVQIYGYPFTALTRDVLLGLITSAAGAFFGAWAAFRLQVRREKRQTVLVRTAALRSVQFMLLQQYSALLVVWNQWLFQSKDEPLRWALLLPLAVQPEPPGLDTGALSFILESSEADLLNKLDGFVKNTKSALGLCKVQGDLQKTLQEITVAADLKLPCSGEELEAVVPVHLRQQMINITNMLYEAVPRQLRACEARLSEVGEFLAREFPGHRGLKYELRPPQGLELPHGDGASA